MSQSLSLAQAAMKVLQEAAIDTLQQDAKEGQQPQDHVHDAGADEAAAVHDLGGATTENPAGNSIGQRASELATRARPPGPTPPTAGDETADHLHGDTGAERFPAAKAATAAQGNPAPLAPNTKEAGDTLYCKEDEEAHRAAVLAAIKALPMEEDAAALFAGTDLSEETKTKIRTIFEAAVVARAVKVVEMVESELITASEAAVQEIREELETSVDEYLDTMVEQWKNENEVAITSGLRSEIAEEFITALRELFEAHDISIPENQVNVVEELSAKVEELEAELNESLNNNVTLTAAIAAGTRSKVLSVACEGLTATQADKIKTLAEGVEFTTEGEYADKLKVIREQYFSGNGGKKAVTQSVVLNESNEPDAAPGADLSSSMASYVSAIGLTNPK